MWFFRRKQESEVLRGGLSREPVHADAKRLTVRINEWKGCIASVQDDVRGYVQVAIGKGRASATISLWREPDATYPEATVSLYSVECTDAKVGKIIRKKVGDALGGNYWEEGEYRERIAEELEKKEEE